MKIVIRSYAAPFITPGVFGGASIELNVKATGI